MSSSSQNKAYIEQQLQFKQLSLNALLEVTQAINNNLKAEELFRIYEFILRAQFDIQQLCVFIKDNEGYWYPACQYGIKEEKLTAHIDVEKNLTTIQSITSTKNLNITALQQFNAIIPVYHKQQPLAYALAGDIKQAESIKKDALKFIQTLTNIIIVAIENKKLFKQQLEQEALRKELELASEIQTTLVPKSLPDNRELNMKAIYQPYGEIGGDYYDVFSLNKEETIICIADISGKGIGAAMLMSNFQANLRAITEEEESLKAIVEKLNERMLRNTEGEKFITFFLGKYHKLEKKLTYINAGHNPPYLVRKKDLIKLETGTTVLGMFKVLPFINVDQIALQKDDLLFFYTDGLIDLENEKGQRFKTKNVEDFLKSNKVSSPKNLNDKLLEKLNDYRQEREFTDDVTVLSCLIK